MASAGPTQSTLAYLAMLGRTGQLPKIINGQRFYDEGLWGLAADAALEGADGFRRLSDTLQSQEAARAAITQAVGDLAAATIDRDRPSIRRSRDGRDRRTLVSDGTLLILDPDLSYDQTVIDDDALSVGDMIQRLGLIRDTVPDPVLAVLDPATIAAALPTVVRTRLPRMQPLCVPTPCIEITCGTETSTAGIFCRDASGRLGITACHHGTGDVGTAVTVGLRAATVTAANVVQDIVFIALDDAFNLPELAGIAGIDDSRAPSQGMKARFEGAKSGATETWISSHDVGLLRKRPTVQLKVQTGPDTNFGDSGSALIDADDRVIGFAFERTAYGERPEFTDWIWAANALAALGLTPVTTQGRL